MRSCFMLILQEPTRILRIITSTRFVSVARKFSAGLSHRRQICGCWRVRIPVPLHVVHLYCRRGELALLLNHKILRY